MSPKALVQLAGAAGLGVYLGTATVGLQLAVFTDGAVALGNPWPGGIPAAVVFGAGIGALLLPITRSWLTPKHPAVGKLY